MDVGILLLRLVVGGLMIGHGTQKLFGWFGGHGIRGVAGWLQSMGFRPAVPLAALTGAAEAGGGLLLVAGFLTPLGAAAVAGVLFGAIVTVHWTHGVWNENGGGELPAVIAVSALATVFAGPGRFSLDAVLGLDLAGTAWGLAALGLALTAAGGTLLSRAVLTRRGPGATGGEESAPETRAAA